MRKAAGANHAVAAVVHTFQVLTATAVGMAVLLALLPSAGHDQLWLLLVAGRMGNHPDPYAQVFEANPPLPAWMSVGVLDLAGLLHLPAPVVLKTMIVLLGVAVALACRHLLRRTLPALKRADRWFLLFTFILLFGAVPARDFAQRDHVLAFLILPYLLTAAQPEAPGRLRLCVCGFAAAGLALKPHQLLIAVAVELMVFVWRRRPRVLEPAVFLLCGAGYILLIRLYTPEFLTAVLPVLGDTYWANGGLNFPQLVGQAVQLHVLAAVTLLLYAIDRKKLRDQEKNRLVTLLLAAGVAATVTYSLQDTGWYYHQLPALVLFSFALALLLADRMPRAVPRWTPWAAAASGLLALSLTFHFMDFALNPLLPRPANPLARLLALDQPQLSPDPAFFAHLAPDAPVMTLTPTVDDAIMPVVLYHLTLAQRYPQFWMLPALLRGELGDVPARHRLTPARLRELSALQRRMMVEDMERWRPDLILVERCQDPAVVCQALEGRRVDLLAFFLADPAFREIFRPYRMTQRRGAYDAYERRP